MMTKTCCLGAVALGLTVPLQFLAQPLPAFEVASVKLHKPEPGPFRVSTGGEVGRINYSNVTLKACIREAYGLRPYQVAGGPGWLNDDRFDIIAKAPGPASKAQLMLMLKSLLADRFHLTFHVETKEMPVYSLVVARKGLRLHEATDEAGGTQIGGDAAHPFTARNISMAQFAGSLSRVREVDRPVLDATGLKGLFDLTLDFAADDPTSTDTAAGPSIFTALQEQLGLKLEPTRGPVEILVVDHAEKPSQN
jgi:uncharacterized protein (TIGR03435 family)